VKWRVMNTCWRL